MKTTGKISTFGGPGDHGVSSSEDLAIFDREDIGKPIAGDLFLPAQPPGTTGLARRLNPAALYIAMRWNYQETPRKLLRKSRVKLMANGRTVYARPADWGPDEGTGRVADLSPAAASGLGVETDDVVECELEAMPEIPAKPVEQAPPVPSTPVSAEPVVASASGRTMTIKDSGWLEEALDAHIPGGEPLIAQAVVIHFTSGATAKSSVEAMIERGVSAHVVVDRDGTILQCRSFNTQCAHAGRSQWTNPRTGHHFTGSVNPITLGIEIANAGNDDPRESDAYDWAARQPGFASLTAAHRNGGGLEKWEMFPKAQLEAVFALTQALVKRHHLDDITGHDCIAPDRKNDPGPAFPMEELRAFCGFSGLPVVFHS